MFHPTTFWEKRTANLEALVLHLAQAFGAGALAGNWHMQLQQLKVERADELLGPNPVPEADRADYDHIVTQLNTLCRARGLWPYAFREIQDGQQYVAARYELRQKLEREINLDTAVGPTMATTLYAIESEEEQLAPVFAFVLNGFIYVFITDANGLQAMQLSLNHMPPQADWTNRQQVQAFWRSELFPYREDLTKVEFDTAIATILAYYDARPPIEPPSETELQQTQEFQEAMLAGRIQMVDKDPAPPSDEPSTSGESVPDAANDPQ